MQPIADCMSKPDPQYSSRLSWWMPWRGAQPAGIFLLIDLVEGELRHVRAEKRLAYSGMSASTYSIGLPSIIYQHASCIYIILVLLLILLLCYSVSAAYILSS